MSTVDPMCFAQDRAPTRPILRYHGGKWRLANWIIRHFPEHRTYVEPFAGAASVLMRKPRSRVEVLNDRYDRLVSAFRVLRDPEQAGLLYDMLRLTPYSAVEYLDARRRAADPIEDARRLIVLGHQGHGSTAASGGKLSGWRRGVRAHGPTSAREWAGLRGQVAAWSDRLRDVYLECDDATAVIRRWDKPTTLHYIDPPYITSTRTKWVKGYAHEMTNAEHEQLAEVLHAARGLVVLSGYRCDLYDALYRDWPRVDARALADTGAERTESLWLSPRAAAMQGTTRLPL